MTDPVIIPPGILSSDFPAPADRTAGVFNAKSLAWANSAREMSERDREIAEASRTNAVASKEGADAAVPAAAQAVQARNEAVPAAAQAVTARDQAVPAAASALNSAVRAENAAASIADGPVTSVNGRTGVVNLDFIGPPGPSFGKETLMDSAPRNKITSFFSLDGAGADWPTQDAISWWNVFTYGQQSGAARLTQTAQQVFNLNQSTQGLMYSRSKHDDTWSKWRSGGDAGSWSITSSQAINRSTFGSATFVRFKMWGGGGSGASLSANTGSVGGGEGGEYITETVLVADLPATIQIIIGSGGVAVTSTGASVNGNPGGDTKFWIYTAPGGLGGLNSVGASKYNLFGRNGGAGGGTSSNTGRQAAGPGGDSVYGGGGGGGSTPAYVAGGVSQFGGAGGAGKTASSDLEQGNAGTIPGGGGGAIQAINSVWRCPSGPGARGEVRLSWW